MDQMVHNISKIIKETCTTPPIPTLTNLTSKQGGYLSRKLQKYGKKFINVSHYHESHQNNHSRYQLAYPPTNYKITNHPHATTPFLPNDPTLINDWIKIFGTIGKIAKKNARNIITKQTTINCKKAIAKYRNILNLQPKRIYKVIFKNKDNTTLDNIKDRQGNILTNLEDIAEEIYIQQSILN